MNKNPATILSVTALFLLTVIILCYPADCLYFSLGGLNLWFQKMIPALFPFMVLSGVMLRMNLTEAFTRLFSPLLSPLFQVRANCIYVIFIGFLCGFPMGAHVTAGLYERRLLTKKEAEYLLAFCNHIGPVYFISFALPTIGIKNRLPALFGMYGIPLLYGLILRHFCYKNALPYPAAKQNAHPKLSACSAQTAAPAPLSFLAALDEAVMASLTGIARLGGYMILFNLLNILPHLFVKNAVLKALLGCLLEITGGLAMLGSQMPVASLCLLSFGGLSCIAQTYSMIKHTDLSLGTYVQHKLILTGVCGVYCLFVRALSF